MTDELIICKRCGSDACYEYKSAEVIQHNCLGCGFVTTNFWSKDNSSFSEIEQTIPELYKALKFEDASGQYWYPGTINNKTKGMIFADGTGPDNWKWCAVLAVPISKREKYKFPPNQTHKMDMSVKKYFEQNQYMDAMEHIGYFKV